MRPAQFSADTLITSLRKQTIASLRPFLFYSVPIISAPSIAFA